MSGIWQLMQNSNKRLIYPQMGGMGLGLANYTMAEVYQDPDKLLEIALKTEDVFPIDFAYPLDFGAIFLHTLGVPLLMPKYDFYSAIENPITSIEALEGLTIPDPKQDGLMPNYIKGIGKIARAVNKPQMVAVVGPFTLAAELAGVCLLAKSTIKNKVFVDKLLDFATEAICCFIQELINAGARVIQISEPTAVILSPALFKQLITPRFKKIMDLINSQAISSIHICGDTRSYLPEILSTNPQIISLDQIMPMLENIKSIPSQVVLAGNLDPVELMLGGSAQEVYKATKELLKTMAPYPNFMVSFGCDCPNNTPLANMRAVMRAVYE